MKKALCFLLMFHLTISFTFSQTWAGTGGLIPDDGNAILFPINVTNLNPAVLDTTYGLAGVSISLLHPYDSDLLIALVAPDGTTVILTSGNGWDGDNYTGTNVTDTASAHTSHGILPFTL